MRFDPVYLRPLVYRRPTPLAVAILAAVGAGCVGQAPDDVGTRSANLLVDHDVNSVDPRTTSFVLSSYIYWSSEIDDTTAVSFGLAQGGFVQPIQKVFETFLGNGAVFDCTERVGADATLDCSISAENGNLLGRGVLSDEHIALCDLDGISVGPDDDFWSNVTGSPEADKEELYGEGSVSEPLLHAVGLRLQGQDSSLEVIEFASSLGEADETSEELLLRNCGEPQCFWMENTSGKYEWISTKDAELGNFSRSECYAADSCNGGLGHSGGGCYKWAVAAESPREPW